MKKFIPVIAGSIAIASFSAAVKAEDMAENNSGFYVGGNYGYLKVESDDDFDDDNDVVQGIVGYRFNSFLALEGSYIDFGSYGNSAANAETTGYTAALKGTIPITQTVELFAKAGQLWHETDYNIASVKGSSDDRSLFAGAGVNFKVTENLLVNAQYTWYDVDLNADNVDSNSDFDSDFKQASVGAEYRF
ncbi:MAG: porin family protein [Gammaproteobacteria bacterium]|jgi:opacity protein-like surface antigen|uniref:Opacity protein n=1 Tax=Marinomonas polaris DSM 16579 TaxID=1122206 RepID=A0A1M5ECM7_9GAMM|nr:MULTISPECIES: porin family protein [Marinomonas]MBU1296244.1 porin family protein [Gammaproteobacteria bacterium]MBU1465682.1 porin family protein [Gammaproteobacteria bacterium]MBU2022254.1 porin family protein [Gammaproteobacteria bacterium]MBU2237927.1 porin family protein [Gammaproteobacteria bacterium]MBU2318085.1 porin family protein [Gammaproteobacteria bacterium]